MKTRLLPAFCLLAFLCCQPAGPAHGFATMTTGDHPAPDLQQAHGNAKSEAIVVAEVNGVPISMATLVPVIREVVGKYKMKLTPDLATKVRKEALDKVVMEELAFQRAQKLGIEITPAMVAERLAAMKKELGGHFETYLQSKGLREEELEPLTKRFLAVQQALVKETGAKVEIDEKTLAATYEAEKEQFISPERVTVTDVVFFLDPAKPQSLEQARRVRQQLAAAEKPEAVEKDGTFAIQTGTELDQQAQPGLYAAAKALQVGEISEPLNADGTIHLLKLTAYAPRVEKSYAEVKDLLARKVEENIRRQRLEEWKKGLRQGAKITIHEEAIAKAQ